MRKIKIFLWGAIILVLVMSFLILIRLYAVEPEQNIETAAPATPVSEVFHFSSPPVTVTEAPAPMYIVIIDPGHQQKADTTMEPDGPGSSTTKYRDTGGTYGQASQKYEYQLNLEISLQLRTELEARGYIVYLTRETNDVNLGNIERAQFAADHNGDVLVRIHANGSTNTDATGAMTICQTPDNPYRDMYKESRLLSDCLLNCYVDATGIKKEFVWETDTMSGNNWSIIPTTILEMGYMTNPVEDMSMSDPEFQILMVGGIADGIDSYFEQSE